MYTNSNTIKLFDSKNNFLPDFDEKIEDIEKSIHGDNYYDTDEELIDTRLIPIEKVKKIQKIERQEEIETVNAPEVKEQTEPIMHKGAKIILDFLPVLFFIIMFVIVIYGGYYFLSTVDFASLIKG